MESSMGVARMRYPTWAAVALALLAGCAGAEPTGQPDAGARCVPGETQACLCLGGTQGVQICRESSTSFGACTGCSSNETDLPTAVDLGGSACGSCEGCCDGTSCVALDAQATQGKCGPRGTSCVACPAGQACPVSCGNTCPQCTYGVTCIGGTCTTQIDPAAQFKILVKSIELSPMSPSGDDWDFIGGGEADPQACIAFAQGGVFIEGCTASCDDSLTCVFDDTNGLVTNASGAPVLFPATILQQGKLRLSGYDADVNFEDLAGQAYFPATTDHEPEYQTGPFGSVVNLVFELK